MANLIKKYRFYYLAIGLVGSIFIFLPIIKFQAFSFYFFGTDLIIDFIFYTIFVAMISFIPWIGILSLLMGVMVFANYTEFLINGDMMIFPIILQGALIIALFFPLWVVPQNLLYSKMIDEKIYDKFMRYASLLLPIASLVSIVGMVIYQFSSDFYFLPWFYVLIGFLLISNAFHFYVLYQLKYEPKL